MLELFLLSMLLGTVAGLLAGLFGLGGGVVIVPALFWLFSAQQFPDEYLMIMAVATSLATIIPTSISSVMAHYKLGTIIWDRVFRLTPGVLFGAGVGAVFAGMIVNEILKWFFISYLIYVGIRMATHVSSMGKEKQTVYWLDYLVGNGIGFLSSILGIGGGTLTVPYLVGRQVPMKNAVAVSSACGLPIALSGTIVYAWLGWDNTFLPEWSLGYIYLPALGGIVICSIFTAPIGAKLAYKLPAKKLKRYFSVVILLIAIKMIFR
jgi:uncharacterized membrane protein YfcA